MNNLYNKLSNITEVDTIKIANLTSIMANNGFVSNKILDTKLSIITMLVSAYSNPEIFNDKQKNNLDLLYNKISAYE